MSNRTLFHVLLVLTMIWAGLSCFSYLVMSLMMPSVQALYEQNPTVQPGEFSVMMQRLLEVPRGYYAGAGLLYALEVVGAAIMMIGILTTDESVVKSVAGRFKHAKKSSK